MTATAIAPSTSSWQGSGVNFVRVLRSEWIKLRTLRSTIWCFGLIVILTVGFGALLALTVSSPVNGGFDEAMQAELGTTVSTLGIAFTQLIAAVLGVLIIGGEYATGMIRSTFAAVPTRLPALFGKIVVLGVTTFVISFISIAITAVITVPLMEQKGISSQLGNPDAWVAYTGGAGYLALIAILSLSIGAILRNSAGGIATALGLLLVVPAVLNIVAQVTQATWILNVLAFLPSSAGSKMYEIANGSAMSMGGAAEGVVSLDGIQGLLVLVAWIVVFTGIASALVKSRDA